MKKIVIIGIGNILLKDDGIGIHIINELNKLKDDKELKEIEFIDGGTSTLDMLKHFQENDIVIIIDALRSGLKPGTIYKLKPEDINDTILCDLSIHDVQIVDIVKLANIMGYNPKIIIFGIEPKNIGYGIEISEELLNKTYEFIVIIKKEISLFFNSV
ncbi:MAG: hydrogenase maturation protease [Clostridiales bacterium]